MLDKENLFQKFEEVSLSIQKFKDPEEKEIHARELANQIVHTLNSNFNAFELSLIYNQKETVKLFLSLKELYSDFEKSRRVNPLFLYLSEKKIERIDDEILDLLLTEKNLIEYANSFNVINYLILAQAKISESKFEIIIKKLKELERQKKFVPYKCFLNNYIYYMFDTYNLQDYYQKKIDLEHLTPETRELHQNNLRKLKILNKYFPLYEKAADFGDRNYILFFIVENRIQEAIDIILECEGKVNFFCGDPSTSITIFSFLVHLEDSENFIKFLKNLYENDEINPFEKADILHHVTVQNGKPNTLFTLLTDPEYQGFVKKIIEDSKKQSRWFQEIFKKTIEDKILLFSGLIDRVKSNRLRANKDQAKNDFKKTTEIDQIKRRDKAREFLKLFNNNSKQLNKLLGLTEDEELFVIASKKKYDFVGLKFSDKINAFDNYGIFNDVFFSYFRELKNPLFLGQRCLFVNFSFDEKTQVEIIKKVFNDIEIKFQQRLLLRDKSEQESEIIESYFSDLENSNNTIAKLNDEVAKLERLRIAFENKGRDSSLQNKAIQEKKSEIDKMTKIRSKFLDELKKFGYEFSSGRARFKILAEDNDEILSEKADKELPVQLIGSSESSSSSSPKLLEKELSSSPSPELLGEELPSELTEKMSLNLSLAAKSSDSLEYSKKQRSEKFREEYDPKNSQDDFLEQSPELISSPLAKALNQSLVLINPRQNYQEVLTGQITIVNQQQSMAAAMFKPVNLKDFSRGCLVGLKARDYDFSDLAREMQSQDFQKNFKNFCELNPRRSNYLNKLKFFFHQKFEMIEERLLAIPNSQRSKVRDLLYIFLANCHQASRESLIKLYENPSLEHGLGHASGADVDTLKKSIFALDKFLEISENNQDISQSYGFLKSVQEAILNPLSLSNIGGSRYEVFYQEIYLDNPDYFSRLVEDFSEQKDHDQFYSQARKQTREFCQKYCQLITDLHDFGLRFEDPLKLIGGDFSEQIEMLRNLGDQSLKIDDKKFFQILGNNSDLINLIYEVSNQFEKEVLSFQKDDNSLTKLLNIAKIFNSKDNIKSLSKEDLKGYQEIINEEKYKSSVNVKSLRIMNIEIFREAERNFVEKSRLKELANSARFS